MSTPTCQECDKPVELTEAYPDGSERQVCRDHAYRARLPGWLNSEIERVEKEVSRLLPEGYGVVYGDVEIAGREP